MPSKSKKQYRFMQLVDLCKKTKECKSKEVRDASKSMTGRQISDYLSTDPSSLPEEAESENKGD
jgi:hypothetical protein